MKGNVDLNEFKPMFTLAKGISLSQVCAISGLESTTIQNWVKRGWIPRPVGKLYSETALARILIINMLRQSMQLEKIVFLMSVINGSVEDRSDDTIDDALLYEYLCRMMQAWQETPGTDDETLSKVINGTLSGFRAPSDEAYERLTDALAVMLYACRAAALAAHAEELYTAMKKA